MKLHEKGKQMSKDQIEQEELLYKHFKGQIKPRIIQKLEEMLKRVINNK